MYERVVFLDRDGVINVDGFGWTEYGYVTRPEDFRFLPGVLEALKMLSEAEYRVVVISNQQCVGKGYMTEEDLEVLKEHIRVVVEDAGGKIDRMFYCTHLKEEDCPCRKPKAGLFLKAKSALGLGDIEGSFYVGDTERDMQAGKAAGLSTILVLSGKSSREDAAGWEYKPDHICGDLKEAAELIINKKS